jgi:hypothetical protein
MVALNVLGSLYVAHAAGVAVNEMLVRAAEQSW